MKIYFAYRSGYISNNRHFKAFEADSVFDWFVQNWAILSDENLSVIKDFLGVRAYGFPISDYKTEEPVPLPLDLNDLKTKIESFIYSNKVIVSENCVEVFTDDDEIELAWYVFDEKFASENSGKVSIWFNETLPTSFENDPYSGKLEGKTVFPKGNGECNTYYMASTIYDSSHIEDLEGVYRIKGVNLPELTEYLRKNDSLSIEEDYIYGLDEIRLMQMFSRLFSNHNQQELFQEITQHSFNGLFHTLKLQDITLDILEKIKIREADSEHTLNFSEHLIEISNNVSEFYSYTILFDDYWLKKNLDLGKSLAAFCSNWEI